MEANYRRIAVAAKNVDTREHDIADSMITSSTTAGWWQPSAR
jgi:hypothetical protein